MTRRIEFAGWALCALWLLAGRPVRAAEGLIAPGKFIPTYAVKYSNTQGWPPLAEAARFDLLDVAAGSAHARLYASAEDNTWQRLKRLNPHMVIVQYEIGPGEYNTASWGALGDGWEWLKQHHGIGSADRWIATGARYGEYLQAARYPNERLMLIGNPRWQQYWLENAYAHLWTKAGKDGVGVDGVFSDNTASEMSWLGNWRREGHPDHPDVPTDYYRDGKYAPETWKEVLWRYLDKAVSWLAARDRRLVLNFGDTAAHREAWARLDAQPHPVFAAMDEGAFVHPWGRPGFNFRSEEQWLQQVATLRGLKHVRALMNIHGNVISEAQDLTRMDARDANGNRAWDVLWYALASFLQGFDDVRQNAYLNFTVWGYSRFFWLKEFDPRFLHLGKSRRAMQRVEGEPGHVYLREFDDGWVVTNPTTADARGIAVPAGRARIVTHDNLERAESQPLVTRFDLVSHRGVVLLKEGRQVSNADNR